MPVRKLETPIFRVSFPHVFKPRAVQEGQEPKYSLTMLFKMEEIKANPAQLKLWDGIVKAVKDCATEEWGTKIPQNLKNPFRDGLEKQEYDGYGEGVIFIQATTKTRPGLVDAQMQRIIAPEDFYAGCYARATINPFAWTFMGKNGVSMGLQNIQKIKDGDAFSGRSKPEDDFDAFGDLPSDDTNVQNATELFG